MRDSRRGGSPSAARRHFLGVSAAIAGRIALGAAVGLPTLGLSSKQAAARDDNDRHDHGRHDNDWGNKWWWWGDDDPHGKNSADPGRNCFLIGTRILTPCGEVAVEDLTIGDLVETLNGPLPVKWIGRRRFKKASLSWHPSVAPIRVARFALDDEYPHRDLHLSPKHSLLVDGALVPVEHLVNGRSIAPAEMDNRGIIEYFHIELETHEVVFAEGAPAETFLVTMGREGFANFAEYEKLYGSDERTPMKPFAPILGYYGGRAELKGLLRLAVSSVIDVRDPIQKARDRIATRSVRVEAQG
jgi:hypothetical protein